MNSFRNRLSAGLNRFMAGRYGRPDELYRFITYFTLILLLINMFLRNSILNFIILLLLAFNCFRIFSRNSQARYRENQQYLKVHNTVKSWFNLQKRKVSEHRQYRFRKCPHCGQNLRLPAEKGTHTVECPGCHKDFEVRI